ncbi:MAG: ATP-binding protein [bacterium]|nr:ATP-binding protein [bacterium]
MNIKQFTSRSFASVWATTGLLLVAIILVLATTNLYIGIPTTLIIATAIIAIVEKALKETKQKPETEGSYREFQALIDTLEDGVIIYTPDFRITFLNQAAERILRIKKESVVGQTINPGLKNNPAFSAITQVIFPSLAPVVAQISDAGWPQITDMTLESPELKLRTTLSQITNNTGKRTGFIKIIRDKTREEEMLDSKREFLDVAAHQLRTPINGMSWAFETLEKEIQDSSLKSTSEEGKNLAVRALKIIDDLLNAARIEGGKFGYKFKEINLTGLVRQIVEEAKRIAEESGLKLVFTPPQSDITIEGDEERLKMALGNIIDNAIKYNTENGNINIHMEQVQGQPFVKTSVEDTGIGMNGKELQNLFKKFTRGEKASQAEPNGSGLGLYIARNIIKNHGGDMTVESREGRGTTVSFTLPTDPSLVPRRETTYENE